MKALITGASGTVGRVLQQTLEAQRVQVTAWDRQQVPIDDYWKMQGFVQEVQPDVVYHLATSSQPTGRENESWLVNYEWTSELAWITRILDLKFVFTSSVMVFSDDAKGPFTHESEPDAPAAGYGYEKRMAEKRVFKQNPAATVVRLGWQIGQAAGSNNMIDFFETQMQEHGVIRASKKWYPACSFLEDTAAMLAELMDKAPGLYMLDSNRHWTFYEIATALNTLHGDRWIIEPTNDFVFDQRMIEPRLTMPALDTRLPDLPLK